MGIRYEDKRKWPATKPLKAWSAMSALGQKRTFSHLRPMSALPPCVDVVEFEEHVRFLQFCCKSRFASLIIKSPSHRRVFRVSMWGSHDLALSSSVTSLASEAAGPRTDALSS